MPSWTGSRRRPRRGLTSRPGGRVVAAHLLARPRGAAFAEAVSLPEPVPTRRVRADTLTTLGMCATATRPFPASSTTTWGWEVSPASRRATSRRARRVLPSCHHGHINPRQRHSGWWAADDSGHDLGGDPPVRSGSRGVDPRPAVRKRQWADGPGLGKLVRPPVRITTVRANQASPRRRTRRCDGATYPSSSCSTSTVTLTVLTRTPPSTGRTGRSGGVCKMPNGSRLSPIWPTIRLSARGSRR